MGAPQSALAARSYRVGSQTHTGRRRANNEDHLLVRLDLGLFAVADGVGGRNTGEVASRLAVLSLANFFEATQQATWPDKYRTLTDEAHPPGARRLSAAIRKANEDVHSIASTRALHHKMNTTVVAAHVPVGGQEMYLAHVGDSRCYRVRDHVMEVLTRDHTLRNEARDQYPHIAPERLAQLPKNMLARALGRREDVEVDVASLSIRSKDVYLLCSDGVNAMVEDTRILEILATHGDPQEAANLLIDGANEAGGRDNITAVVLQFP